jgi:hypothetical protein
MIHVNWNPTDRQLRQFGLAALVAFPLLAWLFVSDPNVVGGAMAVGAAIATVALVHAKSIKPVYLALTLAVFPIGLVVGELMIVLVYGLLVVPVGAVMKAVGHDPLRRRIDRNAKSYWQSKDQPREGAGYFRKNKTSVAIEFLHHVVETGQWWMLPLLIAIGLMGALVWLGGTGIAPFIYPLF